MSLFGTNRTIGLLGLFLIFDVFLRCLFLIYLYLSCVIRCTPICSSLVLVLLLLFWLSSLLLKLLFVLNFDFLSVYYSLRNESWHARPKVNQVFKQNYQVFNCHDQQEKLDDLPPNAFLVVVNIFVKNFLFVIWVWAFSYKKYG